MKKLLLATLVLATSATAFAAAENIDGTITFNGKLVDNTCVVNDNSKNQTVKLPDLPISRLAEANKTAGLTLFQIQLDKCGKETKARAYFVPTPNKVDLTSGRLINTATDGAAKNVQVQLVDSDGTTEINATGTGGNQGSQLQTINGNDGSKLNYYARYYATGTTTAGTVNASVDYYVEYE
ncbi:fimbrial protein [Gallibacterium anatis]|uniref:fimbrial protein n=1 Tax=Gallibacterium anatis TaxID=750 RepID=UPI0030075936